MLYYGLVKMVRSTALQKCIQENIHMNEFRFTIKYKISIKNAAFNVVSSFLLDLLHPRVFVCGSFHKYGHGNYRRYNG